MASRQGACPGAIPGNRTNLLNYEVRMQNDEVVYAARQLAQQGLQNSAILGRHQGGVPILHSQFIILTSHFGVVADKQCTCPASKPMRERYPPTPPAFVHSARGCRRRARSIAVPGAAGSGSASQFSL